MSRTRRQNEISLVDRVVEFVVRSVGFTADISEKKKEFYCDPFFFGGIALRMTRQGRRGKMN